MAILVSGGGCGGGAGCMAAGGQMCPFCLQFRMKIKIINSIKATGP